jgi:hypothetical protein
MSPHVSPAKAGIQGRCRFFTTGVSCHPRDAVKMGIQGVQGGGRRWVGGSLLPQRAQAFSSGAFPRSRTR